MTRTLNICSHPGIFLFTGTQFVANTFLVLSQSQNGYLQMLFYNVPLRFVILYFQDISGNVYIISVNICEILLYNGINVSLK